MTQTDAHAGRYFEEGGLCLGNRNSFSRQYNTHSHEVHPYYRNTASNA